MKIEGKKILHTDVLIIGGGTAGCYAAMTIREQSDYSIIIAEKANIRRSGCLAAGVNALNAYITKGHVPQDYVDYATKDADGIVRPDLLLTRRRPGGNQREAEDEIGHRHDLQAGAGRLQHMVQAARGAAHDGSSACEPGLRLL